MAVATWTGWTFENFSRAVAIGGPTTRARHDDRILWRWGGFIGLRMFSLGVDGAAIDRATALLAPDDPGHGQPQIHSAIIGEQMEKVICSKRTPKTRETLMEYRFESRISTIPIRIWSLHRGAKLSRQVGHSVVVLRFRWANDAGNLRRCGNRPLHLHFQRPSARHRCYGILMGDPRATWGSVTRAVSNFVVIISDDAIARELSVLDHAA
jgi:hypothetical protein